MRATCWRALLVVAAMSTEVRAEAEHYEHIRVDVGMSGSTVSVSDRNASGFVAEIKVNAHDNIAVGGRVEIAVMFGGRVADEELPFGLAAAALFKGEYLLGTGVVRPFVGLGAGFYSIGSHTIVDDDNGNSGISTTAGRYFGVAPEVGVDLGRLRLAVTYNEILGTSVEHRQTTGGIEHREAFSPDYLTFEIAFRFGGHRKPPSPSPPPAPPTLGVKRTVCALRGRVGLNCFDNAVGRSRDWNPRDDRRASWQRVHTVELRSVPPNHDQLILLDSGHYRCDTMRSRQPGRAPRTLGGAPPTSSTASDGGRYREEGQLAVSSRPHRSAPWERPLPRARTCRVTKGEGLAERIKCA